ncbi:hypothetical protein D3C78_1750010 [compost metagenome]
MKRWISAEALAASMRQAGTSMARPSLGTNAPAGVTCSHRLSPSIWGRPKEQAAMAMERGFLFMPPW